MAPFNDTTEALVDRIVEILLESNIGYRLQAWEVEEVAQKIIDEIKERLWI